jgi:hypothetical protein
MLSGADRDYETALTTCGHILLKEAIPSATVLPLHVQQVDDLYDF